MRARDRLVILVVVVVAAVVGAWLMVIQPKRDQAAKLGSQVSAAQSQLNSARADVARCMLDEVEHPTIHKAAAVVVAAR